MENSSEVKTKARVSIYPVIVDWFREQERGKILDAPAGYGYLSQLLKELGNEVTCGEIEPEIFEAPGLEAIYTDLNRKINAPDNSFDYIVCVDGLEHMTDPYQAVAEFSRVLKPGGYGIFSIPNYSNIEKRFQFLTKGCLTKPVPTDKYIREGANLFNLHNSPLTITLLEFMLRINHLKILEFKKNASKPKQYFFYPLVFVLRMLNAFASEKKKRKHRTDLTLHPDVVFGGNNLILITQKHEGEVQESYYA